MFRALEIHALLAVPVLSPWKGLKPEHGRLMVQLRQRGTLLFALGTVGLPIIISARWAATRPNI